MHKSTRIVLPPPPRLAPPPPPSDFLPLQHSASAPLMTQKLVISATSQYCAEKIVEKSQACTKRKVGFGPPPQFAPPPPPTLATNLHQEIHPSFITKSGLNSSPFLQEARSAKGFQPQEDQESKRIKKQSKEIFENNNLWSENGCDNECILAKSMSKPSELNLTPQPCQTFVKVDYVNKVIHRLRIGVSTVQKKDPKAKFDSYFLRQNVASTEKGQSLNNKVVIFPLETHGNESKAKNMFEIQAVKDNSKGTQVANLNQIKANPASLSGCNNKELSHLHPWKRQQVVRRISLDESSCAFETRANHNLNRKSSRISKSLNGEMNILKKEPFQTSYFKSENSLVDER